MVSSTAGASAWAAGSLGCDVAAVVASWFFLELALLPGLFGAGFELPWVALATAIPPRAEPLPDAAALPATLRAYEFFFSPASFFGAPRSSEFQRPLARLALPDAAAEALRRLPINF